MNEHVFAADGMYYHVSQVEHDTRTGRYIPRPGAQPGKILEPTEFGEMPRLSAEARAHVDAWRARSGAAPKVDATYHTKVETPEASPATLATKAPDADEPTGSGETRKSTGGGSSRG